MFDISCGIFEKEWNWSPISFKHVLLWCLVFDPHQTTHQANIRVLLRNVTKCTCVPYAGWFLLSVLSWSNLQVENRVALEILLWNIYKIWNKIGPTPIFSYGCWKCLSIDSSMNAYPSSPHRLIAVIVERSVLNKSWRCCSSLKNMHLLAYGGCSKTNTHHTP